MAKVRERQRDALMFKHANRALPQAATRVAGWYTMPVHCVAGLLQAARATRRASPRLFLREMLASPGAVGAVWPSSRKLASCMAAPVPVAGDGLVVELGAGTGIVTEALLQRGVSAERLRVIERSPSFVQCLRQRFSKVAIVHGNATQLADLLPEDARVDAIVSSLPLRSLPAKDVIAIVDQWRSVLSPGGTIVQFTYGLRGQPDGLSHGFARRESRLVWANMPPAKVMVFARNA